MSGELSVAKGGGPGGGSSGRKGAGEEPRPDRAVVDIGSNTVRMVIYSGSPRAPDIWLNEKVTARLGRELATTGRMPDKAMDNALAALARFVTILKDIGLQDVGPTRVHTVATAAVRDAANGPEFLERVRALGLNPRLLSGEEEARISALGVIGAFPGARGVVADLGGGSLELVSVERGDSHHGTSLPLGTLRLPALRAKGEAAFEKAVASELDRAHWAKAAVGAAGGSHPGPLYLVGGTWRALAAYAMDRARYPLKDPHGLVLSAGEADKLARKVMRTEPAALSSISGISGSRAAGLADAAAMLRVILAELEPDGLAFSSWGLREGVLLGELPAAMREQDPLLAAIAAFGAPRGARPSDAAMIAAWTADVASGPTARRLGAVVAGDNAGGDLALDDDADLADDSGLDYRASLDVGLATEQAAGSASGSERLRLAATMLALAAARIEPFMRLRHATDWALNKRWVAIDHRGRAIIAAALRASCGRPEPLAELVPLAGEAALREAAGWGLAIRLCRRIGAGSRISLLTSSLTRRDETLVLWLDPTRAQLANDSVLSDLRNLAGWMGLDHELQTGTLDPAQGA